MKSKFEQVKSLKGQVLNMLRLMFDFQKLDFVEEQYQPQLWVVTNQYHDLLLKFGIIIS